MRYCCAVTGEGLDEALNDVEKLIDNKRTKVNKFSEAAKGKLKTGKKVRRSLSYFF